MAGSARLTGLIDEPPQTENFRHTITLMDIAIVTGASSALGLAISKRLIQLGFRVYGLGGDYADCSLKNVNFRPVGCDLADPQAVESAAARILEKEKGVYVLVNNAKFFGRNRFQEMDPAEMERVLRINLLCPLVLARILARSLMQLQGFLIQLGSPYAETSRGGAVGAAAAGGLKWMGEMLFQEFRDHGVKVCHLSPEPNRGRETRGPVRPGARLEAAIDPEAVAQAIEQILQSPFGNVVTEMVMRPLRVSEPEHEPVVRLPYPEPKPVPYTVPRELIEAEEQLEDEQADQSDQSDRSDKSDKSDKPRRRGRRKPRPQKAEVGCHDRVKPREAEAPAAKAADPTPVTKTADSKPAAKTEPEAAKRTPAHKAVKKSAGRKTARKAAPAADAKEKPKTTAKTAPAKKATRARKRPARKAVAKDDVRDG
jgi:NAD(P)-dependent dehydrogenase (short-subunit alcohol dehydrogenase family)